MAFEVLATIVGEIADQAEAEQLAKDIFAVVARARALGCALGCMVEIRDMRLGRELQRIIRTPDDPRQG